MRMALISSSLSAALFRSSSPAPHCQVPFFGSKLRHSGKSRTVVTPAAAIFGNQAARSLKELAEALTPQGPAGGDGWAGVGWVPASSAAAREPSARQNRARVEDMKHLLRIDAI